ncbi:MAG: hypothetical protein ACWGQW_17545 [bacterium]
MSLGTCLPALIVLPWEEVTVLFNHLKDEMRVHNVLFLAAPPNPTDVATIERSDHSCVTHFVLTAHPDHYSAVTAEGFSPETLEVKLDPVGGPNCVPSYTLFVR